MTDSIAPLNTENWLMGETVCQSCQNVALAFYPFDLHNPIVGLLECGACGQHQAVPDIDRRVLVLLYRSGDSFWFSMPRDEGDNLDEVVGTAAGDIHAAAGLFLTQLKNS